MPEAASIDTGRFQKFMATYRRNLIAAREKHPEKFVWDNKTSIDDFLVRMGKAFAEDSYNISGSIAIGWTCKELGIKKTRKAIKAYLRNTTEQ